MLYDVSFSVTVFKRQPDDTQIKIVKVLGVANNISADTDQAAIAIAARTLGDVSQDELSVANVALRKF